MICNPGQLLHEADGNRLSVYWYVNSTRTRVRGTSNESGKQSGFNSSLLSSRIKKPAPSAAGLPLSINSPVAIISGATFSFLQAIKEIINTIARKIIFLIIMIFRFDPAKTMNVARSQKINTVSITFKLLHSTSTNLPFRRLPD